LTLWPGPDAAALRVSVADGRTIVNRTGDSPRKSVRSWRLPYVQVSRSSSSVVIPRASSRRTASAGTPVSNSGK
jgi:hypothetical protein